MSSYTTIAECVPSRWLGFWPMWQSDHLTRWRLTSQRAPFVQGSMVRTALVVKRSFLSLGGPQRLCDMGRFRPRRALREASLAGLTSAFMSTLSATINASTWYLPRNGYQKVTRPDASDREWKSASGGGASSWWSGVCLWACRRTIWGPVRQAVLVEQNIELNFLAKDFVAGIIIGAARQALLSASVYVCMAFWCPLSVVAAVSAVSLADVVSKSAGSGGGHCGRIDGGMIEPRVRTATAFDSRATTRKSKRGQPRAEPRGETVEGGRRPDRRDQRRFRQSTHGGVETAAWPDSLPARDFIQAPVTKEETHRDKSSTSIRSRARP